MSLRAKKRDFLAHGVVTHKRIYVRVVKREQFLRVYHENPVLKKFVSWYGISYKTAKSLLERNGLDFCAQLTQEYRAGDSLKKLSDVHGPKPNTLAHWLQDFGVRVKAGNHRRDIDIAKLKHVFEETKSVNKAAKAAGVHWTTANRILHET